MGKRPCCSVLEAIVSHQSDSLPTHPWYRLYGQQASISRTVLFHDFSHNVSSGRQPRCVTQVRASACRTLRKSAGPVRLKERWRCSTAATANQAHLLSYAHIPEAERTRKWIRLGNCLRDIETVHWRKRRRRRRRTQQSSSSQLDAFWILPVVGPVRARAHLEEEEADGGSPGESVSQ